MNTVYALLTGEVGYALGWTVVHSLWQGMLIAILLAVVLIALQKRSAHFRYLLANFSLLALLLASAATFFSYYQPEGEAVAEGGVGQSALGAAASRVVEDGAALSLLARRFEAYFEEHLPLILCIWLLGVAFFVLRLLGGIAYIQHLKHYRVAPLSPPWQQRLQQLAGQLRLSRPVRLMESALVKTPMAIGYLKPVVLLPVGAINGLTAEQVEAILAHELAHIYRKDFLFNILQSLIEALYYFNPAVWWISANIRMERENCCDDIAVALCGNSLAYAKALVKIEEASQGNPRMAMALARKGKGRLLHRVRRILGQPQNKSNIMEKFTTTALLLAAIFLLSASASRPAENLAEMETFAPLPSVLAGELQPLHEQEISLRLPAFLDTLPDGKVDIHSHKDGKEVRVRIRDRKITELEVDGQKIPESEFGQYEEMVEKLANTAPDPPRPPRPPRAPAPPAPPAAPAPPAHATPPAPPAPPALPAPPRLERQEVKHITAKKKDNGTTAVIIEKNDGETIEFIVADEDGGHAIYLDGEELEDGETRVVIEGSDSNFFRLKGGNLFMEAPGIWFETPGPDGELWKGAWDAEREAYRELMEHQRRERERIQEEMRKAREQLRGQRTEERERLLEELKAQQEEIRRQTEEAMEQYREQLRQNREEMRLQFDENNFQFGQEGNYLYFFPEGSGRKGNAQSALEKALLADGLIETAAEYRFELSGKGYIRANGKKQSQEAYQKYKRIWEETTGGKVDENTHIRINKKSQ
ncbi:MAG: M56 family metallopeptidase [Phaeodactylibacter sp.]|nr:M56 family metallopeptidase [Phaeodactylibacter sp.]